MKVYLGPYKHRKWWHRLLGLEVGERKVKIKLDRYDHWNADHTIALIAAPLLKDLKAHKHGFGFIDDEDVPEELRSDKAPPKENEYDWDENAPKRYEWALDEMIYALEQEAGGYPDEEQFHSGEHDIFFKQIEGTEYSEMCKGPKDTYKLDREGYDKYHKRVSNGFRLFGKYFQTLWD